MQKLVPWLVRARSRDPAHRCEGRRAGSECRGTLGAALFGRVHRDGHRRAGTAGCPTRHACEQRRSCRLVRHGRSRRSVGPPQTLGCDVPSFHFCGRHWALAVRRERRKAGVTVKSGSRRDTPSVHQPVWVPCPDRRRRGGVETHVPQGIRCSHAPSLAGIRSGPGMPSPRRIYDRTEVVSRLPVQTG